MKGLEPRFSGPRILLLALAPFLGSCNDPGLEIYPAIHTDLYQQQPLRQVDVLLVVDNSGSMIEEQTKLAANFQSFIKAFVSAEVDYHIGVITTDVDNMAVAGLLQGTVKVITPETENPEAVFAENVQVGTNGSGYEMGLEAARLALSEPRLSGVNAGFLRQDAALSLAIFSDENDMSPYSVDDYLNFFASLKDPSVYRDKTLMNLSAVVGDVPFGCESTDGSGIAYAGARYVDAATRTEGVFASICASDFAPIVQALGLDLSGLRDEFPLTRCARPDTLQVVVNGRLEPEGVAWVYSPEQRTLRFTPNWVPGPEEQIAVYYEYYAEDTQTCPVEEDAEEGS